MSYQDIRAALELRLDSMNAQIPTAWENVIFNPPEEIYQRAYLLPSTTQNPTFGDSLYRESGIFQISIYAPFGEGTERAILQGEEIRSWFYRGLTLIYNNVKVIINGTPYFSPAMNEGNLYILTVSIPYFADL